MIKKIVASKFFCLILILQFFVGVRAVVAVDHCTATHGVSAVCDGIDFGCTTAVSEITCESLVDGASLCCTWVPDQASPVPGPTSPTGGKAAKRQIIELTNPLGGIDADGVAITGEKYRAGTTSITAIVAKIVSAALGLVGSAALIMFLYGGFLWVTSVGNEDKVKEGLNAMLYAAIGIAVVFSSYALLRFLFTGLNGDAQVQTVKVRNDARGTTSVVKPESTPSVNGGGDLETCIAGSLDGCSGLKVDSACSAYSPDIDSNFDGRCRQRDAANANVGCECGQVDGSVWLDNSGLPTDMCGQGIYRMYNCSTPSLCNEVAPGNLSCSDSNQVCCKTRRVVN